MDIQINKKWKIGSDELNVTLCRRTEPTDKNPDGVWRVVGYYGKIEHAVQRLIDQHICESKAKSFEKLISDIKEIRSITKYDIGIAFIV